jgi:hypothetical protein
MVSRFKSEMSSMMLVDSTLKFLTPWCECTFEVEKFTKLIILSCGGQKPFLDTNEGFMPLHTISMRIKCSIAEKKELILWKLISIQIKILNNFACNLN